MLKALARLVFWTSVLIGTFVAVFVVLGFVLMAAWNLAVSPTFSLPQVDLFQTTLFIFAAYLIKRYIIDK